MNRISSARASKPSNLSRNRLDGFDALADDIRFIYSAAVTQLAGSGQCAYYPGALVISLLSGRGRVPLGNKRTAYCSESLYPRRQRELGVPRLSGQRW